MKHTYTRTHSLKVIFRKLFVLKIPCFPCSLHTYTTIQYIGMRRNLMRKKLKIHAKHYIFYEQARACVNSCNVCYTHSHSSEQRAMANMVKHLSVAIQMCHIHCCSVLTASTVQHLKWYCCIESQVRWGFFSLFFFVFSAVLLLLSLLSSACASVSILSYVAVEVMETKKAIWRHFHMPSMVK